MLISVHNNSFLFKLETEDISKIKLISEEEEVFVFENKEVLIPIESLKIITNNKKKFVKILFWSNEEWVPINISDFSITFDVSTEISDSGIKYICYIGGDNYLKIYNEGFISNKIILQKVMLTDFIKDEECTSIRISLSTKYFIPNKVNLFLRDRKTNDEIQISTNDLSVTSSTNIDKSFGIIYHCEASFKFNNNDFLNQISSVFNLKEPFFNWIDFYYNFEIKEYTTSSYAFRLPTKITHYSEDLFFKIDNENTCLLKKFGTENKFFSLNYYIYNTKELTYFIDTQNKYNNTYSDNKPVIIVGEYYNTARDNGLAIFKYLIDNHKNDFHVYYGIQRESADLNNLKDYMEYVKFIGTYDYSDCFIKANVIIHSHSSFYLCPFYTQDALESFKEKTCYFIQHGIILQKDVSNLYSFDNQHLFNYFITSSKRESKVIKEQYHFPEKFILEYGLPRFDKLFSRKQRLKKINTFTTNKHYFAFFTWRTELNQLSIEEFIKTDYYKNITQLINDPFWNQHSKLTLTIRLHRNFEKYIHLFSTTNKNIFILTDDDPKNIQDYIINSDVMITDYSSAALDFAIMSKPVIYYLGLAENKNEDSSYLDYLPGDIIYSYEDLLNSIEELSRHKKNTTKYGNKLDDIYLQRDNKACYRLAEHIKNNTKKS